MAKPTISEFAPLQRIHEVHHHGLTLSGHRLERRCGLPLGRRDYRRAVYKKDEALMNIRILLQDYLFMHAGPVDPSFTPEMVEQMKDMTREELARLMREGRAG